MKPHRHVLLLVLACACTRLAAQNLVPNGSFEEVLSCPMNFSEIDNAYPWLSFRASPDLFHGCATGNFDVPTNIFGTRTAATGIGYAGMYCYYSALPNRREYIGVQLTEPLTPGVPTYVSFKVAAGGGGGETWVMLHWTSGIGVKFSMDWWFEDKFTDTVSNEADIYYGAVVEYSPEWLTVSGIFIPDSAYTFVVVGNFFADDQITVQPTGWPGASTPGGYYYVDDICVSQGAGENCEVATSVPRSRAVPPLSAWYDAGMESVRVAVHGPGTHRIALLDATGRPVREALANGSGSQVMLPVSDLATAIYIVRCGGGDDMHAVRVHVP